MSPAIQVRLVGPQRMDDVSDLFGTNKTTSGCYCVWFLTTSAEFQAGYGSANRAAFEEVAASDRNPVGLLAYRGSEPVGWCAFGPRSRYGRALRSRVLRGYDETENDQVWLVPCFYVRRDARGSGVTRLLLETAIAQARKRGATAIEGFPLSGDRRRGTGEAFLGVEPLFAQAGFTVVSRPTPGRVLMRLDLT